jgi:hypothetical protein
MVMVGPVLGSDSEGVESITRSEDQAMLASESVD